MFYLKIFLQLFSIDSAEKRLSRKEISLYVFKAALSSLALLALVIYVFIYKINNAYSVINTSIVVTDAVQVVYDYIQYIIDLIYVFIYGRHISEVYYKQYESLDYILDVTHSLEINKKVGRLVGVFAVIWISTSCFDFYAWYLGYGISIPLVFASAYLFFFLKILTMLDLTSHVLNIQCRLRVIGDIVQDYYNVCENVVSVAFSKGNLKDSVWNKNWFYSEGYARALGMRSRVHPLSSQCDRGDMRWLGRCYLLLSEQCTFINNMFGMRLTLNSLSMLLDMVRFLNVSVRVTIGTQPTENAGYYPAVSSLFRLLACASILLCLVHHCEKTYRQCDRIVSIIDHLLYNKNPDPPLRSSASDLRQLISSRPISFNMAYYFELNKSFLVSMASVVVTYTIILIQST